MKKSNLVLLIVLVLLGLFFFVDTETMKQQEEQEAREKQLIEVDGTSISVITLQSAESTIRGVTSDAGWMLQEPLEAPGDQAAWNAILDRLTDGEHQRVIATNPDNPDDFGLNDPRLTATLEAEEGTTIVDFGDESPVAGKYFALIRNTSEVVTVSTSMFNTVNKNLFDLRDKTVLDLQNEGVSRIEVTYPDEAFTLERQDPDIWILSEPVKARADAAEVRKIITAVNNASIQQFIDEEPEVLAAYGLVEPATTFRFTHVPPGGEGFARDEGISLGTINENEHVYAMRTNQQNVFALDPKDFANVPTRMEDFRMTDLTELRSWNIDSFTLHAAGEVILEASKDSGDWFLKQPEEGLAEYTQVSELVRNLVDLEMTTFVEGSLADFGLDAPDYRIELRAGEDTDEIPLVAGTIGSGTEAEPVYYGYRENPLEIYRVSAGAVDGVIQEAREVSLIESEMEPETESDTSYESETP